MYCPFCKPTHPIVPGVDMPCGSVLDVMVVQTTISASVARANGIVCIKCGGTGVGALAPFHDGYVHVIDCNPSVRIAPVMPKRSLAARIVSRIPPGPPKPLDRTSSSHGISPRPPIRFSRGEHRLRFETNNLVIFGRQN